MIYINIKRIHGRVHCGEVNLPYDTEFDVDDQNFLYTTIDGVKKRICWETSEFAYQNFAYNEDGNGIERDKLIHECIDIMKDINKDVEFVKLFDDFVAMKYKDDPKDMKTWAWDRLKVHRAPLGDLRYLKGLFEGMEKIRPEKVSG